MKYHSWIFNGWTFMNQVSRNSRWNKDFLWHTMWNFIPYMKDHPNFTYETSSMIVVGEHGIWYKSGHCIQSLNVNNRVHYVCRRRLPESFYYISICHEHQNLMSFSIKFWKLNFMCRSYGGIVQNTCVEAAPWTRMVCSKVNIVVPFQVRQKLYYFLNAKILEN